MQSPASTLSFPRLLLLSALFSLPACANRTVNLVNPQSGATLECSGSGFGLATAWLHKRIDDCIRRSETRGYVLVDRLTPEQRADLESRGALSKGPAN
jgi:hypothetical protein